MNLRYLILNFCIVCLAVESSTHAAASDTLSREYKVKLAFLYKFAEYVRIPKEFDDDKIHIAVIGQNPFGIALERIATRKPQGRQCVPIVYESLDEVTKADIIFIPHKVDPEIVNQCLALTKSRSVLVIGEHGEFLGQGGVANFQIGSDGRIKIQVNEIEVKRRKLMIDARLLAICDRVVPRR